MNEHAGPASALSVLIVGVFAILLHDRQPPPKSSPLAATTKAESKTRAVESPIAAPRSRVIKETSKTVAVAETRPPLATQPSSKADSGAGLRRESAAPKEVTKPRSPAPAPTKQAAVKRSSPAIPKSPYTVVEAGESLEDVANRIYGSPEAAESLWRANRDQLASIDSSLNRGTLLRTP